MTCQTETKVRMFQLQIESFANLRSEFATSATVLRQPGEELLLF